MFRRLGILRKLKGGKGRKGKTKEILNCDVRCEIMRRFLRNHMRKVEIGEWIWESVKGSYSSYAKLKSTGLIQGLITLTDLGFLGDCRKLEEFYCILWKCDRMVLWSVFIV